MEPRPPPPQEGRALPGGLIGRLGLLPPESFYQAGGGGTSVNSYYTFTWDDLNRLVECDGPTRPKTTGGYDARGLRVWSSSLSGVKTFYIYDGGTLLGEVSADPSTSPATVAVTAAYTWGAAGLVAERRMAQGGGVPDRSLWYHFGPQGETRQLTDANGNVADAYAYTAYGATAGQTGSDANPFRYGGQEGYYAVDTSAADSLYLCGLRWYDASLGRFLSRDPIGYGGGSNLYDYCNGNPVNAGDPDGLSGVDVVQGVLTGVGFVPGLGEVTDVASAVVSAATGDWAGAGLSVAGMIPVLGDGALAAKAARLAAKVRREALAARAAERAAKAAEGTVKACRKNCFVAGTPVQMADGTVKPIDSVQVGDWVKSRNPETRVTEAKQVTATFSHYAPQVLTLTLSDPHTGLASETVTCTPNHPFYVDEKGFVSAGQLGIGTHVVTRAGPLLTVSKVSWHQAAAGGELGAEVYNFTVEGDHTYFVGKANGGTWVHNSCEFSIINWDGYPNGVPKPKGPFKILEGADYKAARRLASNANRSLHRYQNLAGHELHEIHPVKFGGDPIDPANKILMTPTDHDQVSAWWEALQRRLGH